MWHREIKARVDVQIDEQNRGAKVRKIIICKKMAKCLSMDCDVTYMIL